jgi:hypothetical protein
MKKWSSFILITLAGTLFAGGPEFEGQSAVVLSNGKIELTVTLQGASLTNLALLDDPDRFSPYRNTALAARLAGESSAKAEGALGHFTCLDGFGAPSHEESGIGYPFHGEAGSRKFEVIQSTRVGPINSIMLAAHLPSAQEFVTRTIRMVDNESVAYVETDVENLLSMDRPISWAEHSTIGPPFLQPGKVIVDMPATRCRVGAEQSGPLPGRLVPIQDFDWPTAPLRNGGSISLLDVPHEASRDLAACQIDPGLTYGYVTAFRKDKRLLFGYVFRRSEFPWLMSWMNYTGNAQAARGIGFSTQPFDMSRRDTANTREMSGMPTYKWLPAKSKVRARFLVFYVRVPDDFTAVADVELDNGVLQINNKAGKPVVLHARLPL